MAYTEIPVPDEPHLVRPKTVQLEGLIPEPNGSVRLKGTLVEVVNRGVLIGRDPTSGRQVSVPMESTVGSADQGFRFRPRSGGPLPKLNEDARGAHNGWALEAARFGEVNSYYHANRALVFANELLDELGEPPLPFLRLVVNTHSCPSLPGYCYGDCGGRSERPRRFGGGHYRLPTSAASERGSAFPAEEINPTGEIHLGPGSEYITSSTGSPVVVDGNPYLRTASHNPGIIVHEVGHHINSHTADFRANQDRELSDSDNRKIHMDEGTADYWAAAILDTPDIFNWQRAAEELDDESNRDLRGTRTTDEFSQRGDPHQNGNIWSSTLWDLRQAVRDPHRVDQLVMKMLVLFGRVGPSNPRRVEGLRRRKVELKDELREGLAMLLAADAELHRGQHRPLIARVMAHRGIDLHTPDREF